MNPSPRKELQGVSFELHAGGRLDPDVLRRRAQALRREHLSRLLAEARDELATVWRALVESVSRPRPNPASRAAGQRAGAKRGQRREPS